MQGRRRTIASLTALALAAGLMLAAVAHAAPTRAEYVAQLEPICQANIDTNGRILKGVRKKIKQDRLGAAGRQFGKAQGAFSSAVDQIAAVPQPDADLVTLSTWIGHLRTEATLLGKIGKALKQRKRSKAQSAFVRLQHNGDLANDTVTGFGFNACLIEASGFS